MSLDGILGSSEHMLDCEILLYEPEERLYIPLKPIDIGYHHSIELQTVNDVRNKVEQFA